MLSSPRQLPNCLRRCVKAASKIACNKKGRSSIRSHKNRTTCIIKNVSNKKTKDIHWNTPNNEIGPNISSMVRAFIKIGWGVYCITTS